MAEATYRLRHYVQLSESVSLFQFYRRFKLLPPKVLRCSDAADGAKLVTLVMISYIRLWSFDFPRNCDALTLVRLSKKRKATHEL